MNSELSHLKADVERVKQIPIIPNMLEVICRSTGMGFAAVARVTEKHWIACSVHDEIAFGLKSGEELPIQTTICNEVRHDNQSVVIDHVAEDEYFRNHHTPKLYGFESYISVPIRLKNGEFFGTLCAIDPKPALLNNQTTIGMFNLFSDLIAFYLQSVELLEQGNTRIDNLNRQVNDAQDEIRQYEFITSHNLREPLRQLRMFTTMLVTATEQNQNEKAKTLALKVNEKALRFTEIVADLSRYSDFTYKRQDFAKVNLNQLVQEALVDLEMELTQSSIVITWDNLPVIEAVPEQMIQVFVFLIRNAIRFSQPEQQVKVHISVVPPLEGAKFVEIQVKDNGIGISQWQQEKIFDVLNPLSYDQASESRDISLAYCRKIVRSHQGSISVNSEPDKGTTFSIILPLTQN
ncbi:GAF domain-containing sensor histidine kinase [Xanthocytophaga flava]|uniref:GAF domain-containing sensor histidine kinase n=1 Tax=Xanthocytophaga flava TaxID=3048013 RepID=UPI0028D53F5F|nr:ATP-binding protein [Xanthocytophaga flavus]MDJ1473561.1 ATP-binding protein [Xanthocytophaga flavus]